MFSSAPTYDVHGEMFGGKDVTTSKGHPDFMHENRLTPPNDISLHRSVTRKFLSGMQEIVVLSAVYKTAFLFLLPVYKGNSKSDNK